MIFASGGRFCTSVVWLHPQQGSLTDSLTQGSGVDAFIGREKTAVLAMRSACRQERNPSLL
ncbi:hypothetical protein D3C71_759650 [compost metagenome]